jgi:ABC-type glycerol-3-phosphate transport system permease component
MKSIKKKIDPFSIINYFLLFVLAVLCVYPFYYVIIYSLSDPDVAYKAILLPQKFTIKNYQSIFALNNIQNAFFVSIARTVLGTTITIMGTSFLAFLMTKEEMFARKIMYRIIVISMYLNAGLIPWYLTMKMYGLKDNFLLYIIPTAIQAYYLILIKTFMEALPASLEEAAKIDGAGYIKCFTRIIFPISKPIIATIAVYSAVGQWNTWMDNYFLVNNENLQTLQMILYNYVNQAQNIASATVQSLNSAQTVKITSMSLKMCITVVVTVPIMCVYPFLQRYFVKGIMMGAVKG